MTFNPCGRVVDFMADTVIDLIRPFRDSSITVRRRWYRVPEGTPTLGVPSAFLSARYEAFPWLERNVGEVYPSPVQFTGLRMPAGMTFDHVCGSAEDFAIGALYNPFANVQYDDEWIPECCGRLDVGAHGGMELGGEVGDIFTTFDPTEGGMELGGAAGDLVEHVDPTEGGMELGGAAGESTDYTDPTEGGMELGGAAGDLVEHVDPTEGGMELGGAAGDVFTPGPVTPGSTCSTAGAIVLGTTYGATTPAFPGIDWWVITGLTPGSAYKVYTTGVGGPGNALMSANSGGSCPPANTVTLSPGPPCWGFTASSDTFVWFQFQNPFGATAYTFQIVAGSCP